MKLPIARRSVLKGLGLGALAATVPMLRSARVFSQSQTIPKRVVFFYAGTGNLATHPTQSQRAMGNWEPLAPAGMSEPTETQFELNTMLAGLADYKKDMILFENLDMAEKWIAPPAQPAAFNAHIEGGTIALTGANRFNDRLPGDISIDQLIAQRINLPSPVTRLPSLEIFGSSNGNAEVTPSATGPGMSVPVLFEPGQIYDRVFPEPTNPVAQAQAMVLAAQRDRVFSFVLGQHGALRDRLSGEDRTKIQEHLDTLSDLQRRLSLAVLDVPIPPRSIVDPWTAAYKGYTTDPVLTTTDFNLNVDINTQIAVAALHADVTRVVMMQVNDPPDHAFDYTPGQFNATDGHDLQHKVNNTVNPQYTDPGARAALGRAHLLVMSKFKNLIDQLAMRTESDGSRLLDHTIVVYCSQIGNGSHDLMHLPWIVVGSGDGYFKTGRYLRLPRMARSFLPTGVRDSGRPHNDLFVSIANAMGVDITTFGNPNVCSGPIAEMRG